MCDLFWRDAVRPPDNYPLLVHGVHQVPRGLAHPLSFMATSFWLFRVGGNYLGVSVKLIEIIPIKPLVCLGGFPFIFPLFCFYKKDLLRKHQRVRYSGKKFFYMVGTYLWVLYKQKNLLSQLVNMFWSNSNFRGKRRGAPS